MGSTGTELKTLKICSACGTLVAKTLPEIPSLINQQAAEECDNQLMM